MEVQKKLVKTFLSEKKNSYGEAITLLTLLFITGFSNLHWYLVARGEDLFTVSYDLAIVKGEYWRLFTASLIHSDLSHLLSNSLMLGLMGFFLASYYGAWIYPVCSFLFGILINYLTILTMPPEVKLLGASGVVHLLWGFWLISYVFIQREVSLNRRFMKVCAVSLVVLVPGQIRPNVSYMAHFIGTVVGAGMAISYNLLFYRYLRSFERYEYIVIEDEPSEDDYTY